MVGRLAAFVAGFAADDLRDVVARDELRGVFLLLVFTVRL
jgi:hypothetical protein